MSQTLHFIDWAIIGAYLVLALVVGLRVKATAEHGRESYFLAGRSLPWWWAGASIAATTFAADTPLAITGIVASKGLSGNWLWLSWVGVHAAVVVYFAVCWNRSRVITDAEFVELRYSGKTARALRLFRAGLYGIVFNCIILGWVLRAMTKIAAPFFRWNDWFPAAMATVETIWPADTPLGTPSEGLTILTLLLIVGVYSSAGGIRGVIATDLLQLALALVGSFWFAYEAWDAVGGRSGIVEGLQNIYGIEHQYLTLLPTPTTDWVGALGIGYGVFCVYLLVQAFANMPADGGGYLMQRLNTTRTPDDARKGALFFLVIQYIVRIWPWVIVAVAALVLIPIGQEQTALDGQVAVVGGDRELAYPILMLHLLPPGILGLLVTSLLAAFMSTIDTHINWGASYIVNDFYAPLRPDATSKQEIRVARCSVAMFVILAVLVSLQIDTIEQAWKWLAVMGAALGLPTILRWVWWRVNAWAEIWAIGIGLVTAGLLSATKVPYELSLVYISFSSAVGIAIGIVFHPPTEEQTLREFVSAVQPIGFWGKHHSKGAWQDVAGRIAKWISLICGTVAVLQGIHWFIFFGSLVGGFFCLLLGIVLMYFGAKYVDAPKKV